jgi:hypothetical protein
MYFQRERQSASYQVSAFYLAEVFTEWPAFFLQVTMIFFYCQRLV